MSGFAQRCGIDSPARRQAIAAATERIARSGVELVRFCWCDQHGMLRGKTLVASAAAVAMQDGIGMVSTLLLKDSSDRTAFNVFEPAAMTGLPGFVGAANLMLLADPESYRQLPWASHIGWVQCQPWFATGEPVPIDTRRILQQALAELAQAGYGMRCGLEVEFHIYRMLATPGAPQPHLDPEQAAWPGQPPAVELIHPGYKLLDEAWSDMADAALRIVQQTAQSLGLPLLSLEIELGPSQVEAVFDATDALRAADNMVLFRNGVTQALRRAGYHASFMCRPPFPNIMSSGWHLHQSLVDAGNGRNLFALETAAATSDPGDARSFLSPSATHYLAGLLAHAPGSSVFCTPTVNGYGRFRPNAMAPRSVVWGRDNRGALLRVIGSPGRMGDDFVTDPATRIENRLGEPAANPYLYMASQVFSGLDGIRRALVPPHASERPYQEGLVRIPGSLGEAITALQADAVLVQAFGASFVDYLCTLKRSEVARHDAAQDKTDWERREYFSRF